MGDNLFWQIIGGFTFDKRETAYLNEVINKLTLMPESDIYEFEVILHRKKKKLCNWDCYGVNFLIDSYPDDEHFSDFRLWIISRGEKFYNTFLENPEFVAEDILTAYNEDMPYLQGLFSISGYSLLKQKGKTLTMDNMEEFHSPRENAFKVEGYGFVSDLTGNKWDSDEDLKERFPKIFDKTKGEYLRYKERHGL